MALYGQVEIFFNNTIFGRRREGAGLVPFPSGTNNCDGNDGFLCL